MQDTMLTQGEVRDLFARDGVSIQIATEGDGSPEIAWGDTFISAIGPDGQPQKMTFATIVTKDYPGFDEASRLGPGRYRLNIQLPAAAFQALLGVGPREIQAADFDFEAEGTFFPHPLYGSAGFVSIINPTRANLGDMQRLVEEACRGSLRA